MKNLKNRILGIGLALLSGAGAFYGFNKIKSEIYAYHKLVHDYNSLIMKCDSLKRENESEKYGKNLALKIIKELMIKNDSLKNLKQKAKEPYSIIKKQRDEEFEEIKKGVMEEFNK